MNLFTHGTTTFIAVTQQGPAALP